MLIRVLRQCGDDLSSGFGYRMNGNGELQFVEEGAASVAELGRVGAVDPVTDFGGAKEQDGPLSSRHSGGGTEGRP